MQSHYGHTVEIFLEASSKRGRRGKGGSTVSKWMSQNRVGPSVNGWAENVTPFFSVFFLYHELLNGNLDQVLLKLVDLLKLVRLMNYIVQRADLSRSL